MIDDAIAILVGSVAAIAGQGISDLISGEWSSWEMYLGAFLGGAIGGWVSLYASPAVGAAVGNGTATLTGKLLELLTKKNQRSVFTIVGDTVASAALGGLLGSVDIDIKGITKGRNSMSAVYKSGLTKLKNGTASKMGAKVIAKGVVSALVDDTYINLVNGLIPGATYWYDGVGTANGGRGSYMCNYRGKLYVVEGLWYGRVYE